jgi:hypothetical protein
LCFIFCFTSSFAGGSLLGYFQGFFWSGGLLLGFEQGFSLIHDSYRDVINVTSSATEHVTSPSDVIRDSTMDVII